MAEIREADKGRVAQDEEASSWTNAPAARLLETDLNLLVALEALLAYRNVSRAAGHIGMTQPAMSRALSRLRLLFGDDLLIRGGNGMILTRRGAHLRKKLRTVMEHARDVLTMKQARHEIRLCVDGSLAPIVLPRLLLDTAGDHHTLLTSTFQNARSAIEQLRARTIDVALGTFHDVLDEDLHSATIASEDFVTLVGTEDSEMLSWPYAFYGSHHALLTNDGVELFPQVHDALLGAGIKRSRIVAFPDVMSAALMAAEGELLLTVPCSIAQGLLRELPLVAVPTPVSIARHRPALYWLGQSLQAEIGQTLEKAKTIVRTLINSSEISGQTTSRSGVSRMIGNVSRPELLAFPHGPARAGTNRRSHRN